MSLLVVGFSHHTADLSLLERLSVPADEMPKALRALGELEHVVEVALLSTCNRVEVYAEVSRFHPGLQEVLGWLAERGQLHPAEVDERHYARYDEHTAMHLFSVASGIDSMVVGEQQILTQVRAAYEQAREAGTARTVLHRLFRQALSVGRRVRRETAISSGASSIVEVGLDIARQRVGDLAGRPVLLVGAGEVGGLAAAQLSDDLGATVAVWNRSRDKAERIAGRTGGTVVDDGSLRDAIAAADLVVCTTGAGEVVIDHDLVARALAYRDISGEPRPLVLLDLAMPRNIDPTCAELAGTELVDLRAVREVAESATGDVIDAARDIVTEEVAAFASWTRAAEVGPIIRALRERAEEVRQSEFDRLAGRLDQLGTTEREAIDALTRGILNTLLHEPTVRLKQIADDGSAEVHVNALRELFDLDD